MTQTKHRAVVLAIIEGGLTVAEAAEKFGISSRWARTLLARYREAGLAGLEPRSRKPHSNPNSMPENMRARILALRKELTAAGHDLARPNPSRDHHPQPQKRPRSSWHRSSWHRFQTEAPNSMWQSNFTHWPLATEQDIEIISWLAPH